MEKVVDNFEQQVWLSVIERPYNFQSPFAGEEFVVMTITIDKTISNDEQNKISDELVSNGCRYAVCAGYECSNFHDAVDWAYIGSDADFNPPKDRFVMTSWHEDESIEDIVEFFALNTSFDRFTAKNFLILFIGSDKEQEEKTVRAAKSFWQK